MPRVFLRAAGLVLALVVPVRAWGQVASAGDGDLLSRMQAAYEAVVSKVAPTVVAIHTDVAIADESGEPVRATGLGGRSRAETGSGVIIREDGMILTSEHVIHNAARISVTLSDGRRETASLVGADIRSDLAVIRVPLKGLPSAELGDVGQVRRGHIVLAMGNPMGLAGDGQAAVSQGIVSAIGRALPTDFGLEQDRYYGDLIQTSAPINPGNSGGPLVDVQGRVVGIVTAIMTRTGASEGLGFAVPMGERTRGVIARLMRGEPVAYGYLGIDMRPARAEECRRAGIAEGSGAVVSDAVPREPGDAAGLRRGDVIVRFGASAVDSADHLLRLIGNMPPGESVRVEYVREGQRRTTTATMGRRAITAAQRDSRDRTLAFRGATLDLLSEPMRRQANVPAGAMVVLAVASDSAAGRAGLQPGEIIVAIDDKMLTSATMGSEILAKRDGTAKLRLINGKMRVVPP